ncbi:MAG: tail fiber protein [Pygmaiobacter sp.]|nr:tail fiber protein [Pygmaiobacter sp.]
MKLTITGKRLDTQAFANVLSQGEKGVEYVEIAADRFYEGTDLAALTWEMWGTYTRYESTAELAVPCVADGDDKVTFTWQPNEFYTIYPGPEELTLVGSDADGNKILKIVGTTPILVRENERKTSSIIIPAQVSNIEQAVNQCIQNAAAAASSAGAAATSATAAETEAAAAAASASLALQISQQNKGWYPSAEALAAAHPTGQNGDWAIVGGDIDTIWIWDSDGAAWKNTHQQTDLSNYYTKAQADTKFLQPTGTMVIYAGANAPNGWLVCNGATISRTTYADLFGILGTTYGAGDGSTTFAVPDMRGRVGVGIGGSGVTTLGQTGGEQTHVITVTEMPQHDHRQKNSGIGGGESHAITNNGGILVWSTAAASTDENLKTFETGGNGAHNNMQPYVGINYIIKT